MHAIVKLGISHAYLHERALPSVLTEGTALLHADLKQLMFTVAAYIKRGIYAYTKNEEADLC